jgi:transketolase
MASSCGSCSAGVKQALEERALLYGEDSVRMTAAAGGGHPSSALSLVHIVSALFYKMRHDPEDPWNALNDRLVLSEGHSVPVVYAAMAEAGYKVGKSPEEARTLTREDLMTLRAVDSPLDGHPSPMVGVPFFDTATGSLGQGLSNANGLILGNRVLGIGRKIYVICGDSEVREGQCDEAMRFAAKYGLDVILVINMNGYGQSGATKDLMPMNYKAELLARNWEVIEVDGHDVGQVLDAIDKANAVKGRPVAILAATVKGWAVSSLQKGNPHGKPLKEEEVQAAVGELRSRSKAKCARIEPVAKPKGKRVCSLKAGTRIPVPDFAKLEKGFADKKKLAPRKSYGIALVELGKINEKVVVLDAEVSNSTFTERFRAAFPSRYFECAIAEQNMIGVGGGLGKTGLIPFVNSFGKFLVMGYAQWEMNGLSGCNVKLVGSHVGITPCSDGPSQMALSDVPYMLSLPNIVVLSASDAVQGYDFVRLAAEHDGWMYLRNYRPDMPLLYPEATSFRIGGSGVLRHGDAITLVSHGYMVHLVKEAADKLAKAGISATVIDAYSLKPLDVETILSSANKTGGRILTAEDNYNGLGQAVALAAAEKGGCTVQTMAVTNWPKSARKESEIFDYLGLSVNDIVAKVQEMLK